jgi:hypothetical protein
MPADRLHKYLLSPCDDTALHVTRRLFLEFLYVMPAERLHKYLLFPYDDTALYVTPPAFFSKLLYLLPADKFLKYLLCILNHVCSYRRLASVVS